MASSVDVSVWLRVLETLSHPEAPVALPDEAMKQAVFAANERLPVSEMALGKRTPIDCHAMRWYGGLLQLMRVHHRQDNR